MAASLSLISASPSTVEADAVVIGVHSGAHGLEPGPGAAAVDDALGGRLLEVLTRLGATGVPGEVTKLATLGATRCPVVAAVGLGEAPLDGERARRAAGAAARSLAGTAHVALALAVDDAALGPVVAEGAALGAYDFVGFNSTLPPTYKAPVGTLSVLGPTEQAKAIDAVGTAVRAVHRARDWVNTPPNHLRPPQLAEQAVREARAAGLEVKVWDETALAEDGFGGILAVGGGSAAAPRLVRVSYTPSTVDAQTKRIALVGKGITFDTGGISIKPWSGMHEMKSDMSGAAAVIATMLAIAELRPAAIVTAYAPLAENMPSGSAYRPGDVVTLYGGKKVEILNTDAEGRIVLGDAIARACEDQPDYLIETSTLTGGQVTSLGTRVCGVMGTPEVCATVVAAGERTGEAMWTMPLPDEVRSGMDSVIADISQVNSSLDRSAHMLQGGVFLRECVAEGVPWAHIDMAGPAYNSGQPHGYTPKGGTGMPVRTLIELVTTLSA